MDAVHFLIASLATYRICRFVIVDKLFDTPRGMMNTWLLTRKRGAGFWRWLHALLGCGWCLSVWVAVAVVDAYMVFGYSVEMPIVTMLAVAAAATGLWNLLEPE